MITKDSPRFFSILTPKNGPLIEAVILRLYDEMYRDITGNSVFDRDYIRALIKEELELRDMEMDEDYSTNISTRAFQVLDALEGSGWVVFKYDIAQRVDGFSFTDHGRRFAASIYEANHRSHNTRMRNVRQTLNSMRAYKENGDPYDLLDARQSSEYIVSDLVDRANEINQARKEMVQRALDDTDEAGELFFEFYENDFHRISNSLTEDSAARHGTEIHRIGNIILDELGDKRLRDLINTFPEYKQMDSPVEELIEGIIARVKNATDNKIPEIFSALSSLTANSDMILRQANSLILNDSKGIEILAEQIRQSDDKDEILARFGWHCRFVQARLFDPEKIKIRDKIGKIKIESIVEKPEEMTSEELRMHNIKEAIRKTFGFTVDDVDAFMKALTTDNEVITNTQIPIEGYRSLLMSFTLPAVASRLEGYEVQKLQDMGKNAYYEGDNYIIKRKESITDEHKHQ